MTHIPSMKSTWQFNAVIWHRYCYITGCWISWYTRQQKPCTVRFVQDRQERGRVGYKSYLIKEYFLNYYVYNSDVTVNLLTNSFEVHRSNTEKPTIFCWASAWAGM